MAKEMRQQVDPTQAQAHVQHEYQGQCQADAQQHAVDGFGPMQVMLQLAGPGAVEMDLAIASGRRLVADPARYRLPDAGGMKDSGLQHNTQRDGPHRGAYPAQFLVLRLQEALVRELPGVVMTDPGLFPEVGDAQCLGQRAVVQVLAMPAVTMRA